MSTVTVLGASGGIGQPLSLLLKLSPNLITNLKLYDLRLSKGVAQDLKHINTDVVVEGFEPVENTNDSKQSALKQSLTGTDLVIIPAGIPRKPGMSRDDLFNINASIIKELTLAIVDYAPTATILVISNPVNSTVPIVQRILSSRGVFNPKKLFGVTTLDIVRSKTFYKHVVSKDIDEDLIHVIGGHSGETIVPIFSQLIQTKKVQGDVLHKLVKRVQFGGDEVVKAKNGGGSATLSMAFSGFKFAEAILKSNSNGEVHLQDSFVYLDDSLKGSSQVKKFIKEKFGDGFDVEFISLPLKFDSNGLNSINYDLLYKLNEYELGLLKIALKQLQKNIKTGYDFVDHKAKSKL